MCFSNDRYIYAFKLSITLQNYTATLFRFVAISFAVINANYYIGVFGLISWPFCVWFGSISLSCVRVWHVFIVYTSRTFGVVLLYGPSRINEISGFNSFFRQDRYWKRGKTTSWYIYELECECVFMYTYNVFEYVKIMRKLYAFLCSNNICQKTITYIDGKCLQAFCSSLLDLNCGISIVILHSIFLANKYLNPPWRSQCWWCYYYHKEQTFWPMLHD